VANVLALTPGTMPIEVTRTPPVIYVHVLHLHDVEAVRRDIRTLSALAVRAFGSDSAVDALDASADQATGGAG
jgi:multisubunit Na+/H+ antiporter MnhE subunit